MKQVKRFAIPLAALSAAILSSCGKPVSIWQDEEKINVLATSTMVTDMVKVVGGDYVEVMGMMKSGVDPHSYEQTAQDVAAMNSADVIFYSGLNLEGQVQVGLEARASRGDDVYAVTASIDPSELIQPEPGSGEYADPHVWGDPALWAKTIDVVVEGLSKEAPALAKEFKSRGDDYRQQLIDLKAWSMQRIEEVPVEQRVLVTSHDAFFYFAKAYQFEVKGLQGISTENVSGVKDVEDLIAFIEARKLKMIFPESSVNRKGIETVAEQAGVALSDEELFSDAMGETGDVVDHGGERYDRGTYLGMQKHNINTVVDGLK
ncbi:metal ABC transporter solute-binding protein, Zn/Mn family [Rubritalea marina]|uniref:metal ABC transporter solute-binding protein, Zn/Mn family n=1 Tax=Rubritalea marina TaxID=361055 RepID=UPI00036EAD06|nr:zinc ABC transporter substrate-binding protein [Rubritalea marina]